MKHIKMVIYGEPGVGKSVFASKAPKPFFITTDGNYEWLEEFGAKEEDHLQVNSWSEAKKAFAQKYDEYETIVVDLVEDLFKWCEYEYCKRNNLDHISDVGFAKGYDTTRNEFFIEICKLLNMDKNIILIMHGLTFTTKDRRGVEHTKYGPTNRLPDKVLDMIEGRVRYFLRAYLKAEEIDGKLVKRRFLSIVPKENEYGILRGINENSIPADIPLEFSTFAEVIGLEIKQEPKKRIKKEKVEQPKVELELDTPETVEEEAQPVVEVEVKKPEVKVVPTPTFTVNQETNKFEKVEQPQQELTNEDKMAKIKAKLAALKAKKGE